MPRRRSITDEKKELRLPPDQQPTVEPVIDGWWYLSEEERVDLLKHLEAEKAKRDRESEEKAKRDQGR